MYDLRKKKDVFIFQYVFPSEFLTDEGKTLNYNKRKYYIPINTRKRKNEVS